jgi:arsenite-transporting ATPase
MRIILFTGKGGTGKTTLAAATALRSAALGYKTLVLSTDPAHSLGDSLARPLGPEPQEVAPNLFAQELDIYYSMQKHWGHIRQLLLTVYGWQGVKRVLAEELSALPGMEEASAFLWLEQYYREQAFDAVVIDSAPTGETLTFLTLPQVMEWWLQRTMPLQKAWVRSFGSAVRMFTGVPLDKGYEEMESLFDKLSVIQQVFTNPEVTSMRLVLNPERMVIQEARRAYTALQLYGYHTDAVLVNRIFPQEAGKGFLAGYLNAQQGYLQEIEESFAPLPILRAPHLGQEVFGMERLERVAGALYGAQDPVAVLHWGKTFELLEAPPGYLLRLALPLAAPEDLRQVTHTQDSLLLQVLSRRRHVVLPRFLSYYTLEHHALNGGTLELRFAPRTP